MNDSVATVIDGISSDEEENTVAEHNLSSATVIDGDSDSESDTESSELIRSRCSSLNGQSRESLMPKPTPHPDHVLQESACGTSLLPNRTRVEPDGTNCWPTGACVVNLGHQQSAVMTSDITECYSVSDERDRPSPRPKDSSEFEESFHLYYSASESELESDNDMEINSPLKLKGTGKNTFTSLSRKRRPRQLQIDESEDSFHLHFSASESELDSDTERDNCSHPDGTERITRPTTDRSRKRKLQKLNSGDSTIGKAKLTEKCCEEKQCMSLMVESDIAHCQQLMSSKNESEQKQFIVSEISKHTKNVVHGTRREYQHHFVISGNFICPKAWCIAHSVSAWRFQECFKLYKAGKVNIQHGNKGHTRKSRKTVLALAWMTNLFKTIGDYMPHKQVVHLPHDWTKKSVYVRMVKELRERRDITGSSISYAHFTRIWSQYLMKFTIPNSTDFTKCTVCTRLKETYDKASYEDERKRIAHLKTTHDRLVEAERSAYQQAREKARRSPKEITCVIVDGMDQAKTDVPHLLVKDKDTSHLARLPVHFTGVLVHTATPEGKIPLIFYDMKQIAHDSNLTIHCITEALVAARDYLGKVLFLQMDNCFRENKNKFVLSYAALLVERDVFEEVYVHFLPVGHTHEDVDQMFSCVAQHLRHTNVYTLEDLANETSKSFTPDIDVRPVFTVQDVKSVLSQHLYGQITNHSRPLWFRFRKVNDRCFMNFKKWESEVWKPERCEEYPHGYLVLKDVPEVSQCLEWVLPGLDRLDVEKLTKDLPAAYKHRLPLSAQQWWSAYMSKFSSAYDVLPDKETWNLVKLTARPQIQTLASIQQSEIEELENIIEEECPDVQIGNQGRFFQRKVTLVDDYVSVSKGDLVSVHLEDKSGRPFIAKVLEVNAETALIHWMRGSWTGPWQMWSHGIGRRAKAYTSLVPIASLMLWGFSLTNKHRLKKHTVEMLKAKYLELDSGVIPSF